jgi:hypothetical protein
MQGRYASPTCKADVQAPTSSAWLCPHLDGGCGVDEGHELGVDQLHLVHLSRHKVSKDLISNGLCLTGGGGGTQAEGLCGWWQAETGVAGQR